MNHRRLLGILWLAISVLRLIPGIFLVSMTRAGRAGFLPLDLPRFVPALMYILGVLMLAGAVAGLLAGWGLLDRQPWARMLAIVLACVNLVDMPFGTALGVYTLWVLLPAQSEADYRGIAHPA